MWDWKYISIYILNLRTFNQIQRIIIMKSKHKIENQILLFSNINMAAWGLFSSLILLNKQFSASAQIAFLLWSLKLVNYACPNQTHRLKGEGSNIQRCLCILNWKFMSLNKNWLQVTTKLTITFDGQLDVISSIDVL